MHASGRRVARRILDVRREVLASALPEVSCAEAETLAAILAPALAGLAATPGTTICRPGDMGR